MIRLYLTKIKNCVYSKDTWMSISQLFPLIDLVKQGNIYDAAARYIELGGNPAPSAVSKTINSFIRKHINLTNEQVFHLERFKSVVELIRREKGIKIFRPEKYKVGTTGVNKFGEQVKIKGTNAKSKIDNVLRTIDKQQQETKKEKVILISGSDLQIKTLAMQFVKDMKVEKPDNDDKRNAWVLKSFIRTGNNKKWAVEIMQSILEDGELNFICLRKFLEGMWKDKC